MTKKKLHQVEKGILKHDINDPIKKNLRPRNIPTPGPIAPLSHLFLPVQTFSRANLIVAQPIGMINPLLLELALHALGRSRVIDVLFLPNCISGRRTRRMTRVLSPSYTYYYSHIHIRRERAYTRKLSRSRSRKERRLARAGACKSKPRCPLVNHRVSTHRWDNLRSRFTFSALIGSGGGYSLPPLLLPPRPALPPMRSSRFRVRRGVRRRADSLTFCV